MFDRLEFFEVKHVPRLYKRGTREKKERKNKMSQTKMTYLSYRTGFEFQ